MSDIRLPQRPMIELPPPIDGLDEVRGEAGRRRRRRAGLVGAGLTTAAGVAVVVALSGGSGGLAVLKPAPPAGPGYLQPSPTVTGAAGVGRTSQHHRAHTAQPSASGHKTAHATSSHRAHAGHGTDTLPPPPTDALPAPDGQVAGAQGPTLSRWQSTYTGATRQCSGSTYGDGNGALQSSVGWCLDVSATPVSDGVRLHILLCRDTTGGGTLSYSGSREVDLAVQQGSKTVWDWAKVHPGGSGTHQLSEPANGCMNWSLVWPDITTAGQSAGHGNFTFVGTSTAEEMQGKPDESVGFTY